MQKVGAWLALPAVLVYTLLGASRPVAREVEADSFRDTSLCRELFDRGLWLHEAVDFAKVPGFGRSLVARSRIENGTLLLHIPVIYSIDSVPKKIKRHPLVQQILIENIEDPPVPCDIMCQQTVLIGLGIEYEILKEMQQPGKSFWGRYFSEWPQDVEDIGGVANFDNDMLGIVKNIEDFSGSLGYLIATRHYLRVLLERLSFFMMPPGVSNDRAKLRIASIFSRTFGLLSEAGSHRISVLPGLEWTNHMGINTQAASMVYGAEKEMPSVTQHHPHARQLVAKQNYVAGDQIFMSYKGSMGNMETFIVYGFNPPSEWPTIGLKQHGIHGFIEPSWKDTDTWSTLCPETAVSAAGKAYSSAHPASYPEPYILCIRAAHYTLQQARVALDAGWLQPWQSQHRNLAKTKKVPAEWVAFDKGVYKSIYTHCKTNAEQFKPLLAFDASNISLPIDPRHMARRRDFAKVLKTEYALLVRCVKNMRLRRKLLQNL